MILTRENSASIMQFRNGKVVHEIQYFADPFQPTGVVEATGSADRVNAVPMMLSGSIRREAGPRH